MPWALAGLVTVQTVATAIIGALAGGLVGGVVVVQTLGLAPQLEFGVAIGVLAVIATTLAAIPPALVAAYRDPVRILRMA